MGGCCCAQKQEEVVLQQSKPAESEVAEPQIVTPPPQRDSGWKPSTATEILLIRKDEDAASRQSEQPIAPAPVDTSRKTEPDPAEVERKEKAALQNLARTEAATLIEILAERVAETNSQTSSSSSTNPTATESRVDPAQTNSIDDAEETGISDLQETKALSPQEKAVSAAERLLELHSQHPIETALDAIAKFFTSEKQYERALQVYERDYKETVERCGRESANTAAVLINMGKVAGLIKDFARKRTVLEEAVSIQEKVFGPDHIEVATTLGLSNLANAYGELGMIEEKEAALKRSLDIYRNTYKTDEHENVAVTMTWLAATTAELAIQRGDSDTLIGCKTALERALRLDDKLFPDSHREVDVTLFHLALCCRELQLHAEEAAALERAVGIQKKVYGEGSLEVVETLSNLANAYGRLGGELQQAKKAEILLSAVDLAMDSDLSQSNPKVVAVLLCNLANSEAELQEYTEAEEHFKQAVQFLKTMQPQEAETLGLTLANLGTLYMDTRAFDKAVKTIEDAIAIKRSVFGDEHRSVAISLANLGQTEKMIGSMDAFRNHTEQAIQIVTKLSVDPNADPDAVEWKQWLSE